MAPIQMCIRDSPPQEANEHRGAGFDFAGTIALDAVLRPQTPVGKCVAGSGFEIVLEFGCLLPCRKGEVGLKCPGAEFRGMRNVAFVVSCEARSQVARQARIALVGMRLASQQGNVMHALGSLWFGVPVRRLGWAWRVNLRRPSSKLWAALLRPSGYGGHQPSLKLRLASRSFSEGWWRRRELNPRPKWPAMTRLRVYPIQNLSPAP